MLYQFAAEAPAEGQRLWAGAAREAETLALLLPLAFADQRLPWSTKLTATDASPTGYGLCEREAALDDCENERAWDERWRYKRIPSSEWKFRERAMNADVLHDIETVCANRPLQLEGDSYTHNESFPEVRASLMSETRWHDVLWGAWKHPNEDIRVKEARAWFLAVRRKARNVSAHHHRHLMFVDNLGLALSLSKGRCADYGTLRVCQRACCLSLAANLRIRTRWIPSEWNVADAGSRRCQAVGPRQRAAAPRSPHGDARPTWRATDARDDDHNPITLDDYSAPAGANDEPRSERQPGEEHAPAYRDQPHGDGRGAALRHARGDGSGSWPVARAGRRRLAISPGFC